MAELHFVDTDSKNIYNEIIESLEKYVKEPLYPGDERRVYGEALTAVLVAVYAKVDDAARQKMLQYARGEVLDALGERTATYRLQSSKAETVLRFAVAEALSQNIIIPQGTKVRTGNMLYFLTDTAVVLQAGEMYVDAPATSEAGGSIYNGILPDNVNVLVDLIPFINSVGNIDTTHGGNDGETYTEEGDNSYRYRIKVSPSKFSVAGPEGAYEYYALSADPSIRSVGVVSPEPGEILLVPVLAGGQVPNQEILDKVVEICSAKTIRPLTDHVTAQAPGQVLFDIEFKYYVTAEDETAAIETIEGSGGSIAKYIDWQTDALGRDINPDQLRRFVLSPDWEEGLTGALRLDVIKPSFTVLADLVVASFSGKVKVSHEVVKE